MKLLDVLLASVAMTIALGAAVGFSEEREDEAARVRWFKAHECRRTSYLMGAYVAQPIYRCNDGIEYIWTDIPRAAP